MIQLLMNEKTLKSIDVWQIKILGIIMRNRMLQESETKSSLISNEIMSSLLTRVSLMMNKKVKKQRNLLKQLVVQKNLDFLREMCLPSIEELLLLTNYYDLPLNLISNSINIDKMNLLQFMIEFKQRSPQKNVEFILNLWKILFS